MGDRIPPSRLLAESVVVIFSILAAFAIDAWWDGRQTRDLEQELLANLDSGFGANRRAAQEVIREAQRQQVLIGRFINMSPAEAAEISPDSTFLFLRALWRPNYVRPIPGAPQYGGGLNNAALLATLEAGRLSLLSDTRLLTALADWQGVADDLAQRSSEVVEVEREVLASLARFPELQSALAGLDGDREVRSFAIDPPRLPGSVARRAREDNELMSRAARKSFLSRVQQQFLEDLEAQADSVLTLVRANLRR